MEWFRSSSHRRGIIQLGRVNLIKMLFNMRLSDCIDPNAIWKGSDPWKDQAVACWKLIRDLLIKAGKITGFLVFFCLAELWAKIKEIFTNVGSFLGKFTGYKHTSTKRLLLKKTKKGHLYYFPWSFSIAVRI